jgi:hypothetical protein
MPLDLGENKKENKKEKGAIWYCRYSSLLSVSNNNRD